MASWGGGGLPACKGPQGSRGHRAIGTEITVAASEEPGRLKAPGGLGRFPRPSSGCHLRLSLLRRRHGHRSSHLTLKTSRGTPQAPPPNRCVRPSGAGILGVVVFTHSSTANASGPSLIEGFADFAAFLDLSPLCHNHKN